MLDKLYIKNFALIEELTFKPKKGLNIITGETGAGKSIIFDALGLILGKRADSIKFFDSESKCILEAEFCLSQDLVPYFKDKDLDFDIKTIIRREITPSGRSRVFINDSPVSLSIAKELGAILTDIHNQHESIGLFRPASILHILDSFAEQIDLKEEFTRMFNELSALDKLIKTKQIEKSNSEKEKDYLQFLEKEFNEISLVQDDDKLEEKLNTLSNAEDIKGTAFGLYNRLSNDEIGILSNLENLSSEVGKLAILSRESEVESRFNSVLIELRDFADYLHQKAENTELDAEQLQLIHERFEQIQALFAKHRVSTVSGLVEVEEEIAAKLSSSKDLTNLITELNMKRDKLYMSLEKLQNKLGKGRRDAAEKLQNEILNNLKGLELPDAQVCFDFNQVEMNSSGVDKVDMLFSSNKNLSPSVVGNAASGGELSRLALVVKSLVAGSVPTLIFDEIDTGVSGRVSQKIGAMLNLLGDKHQVISITHSPQVAAIAPQHFYASKITKGSKITTSLDPLTENERINILAQMLSGEHVSEEALANAKALLVNKLN